MRNIPWWHCAHPGRTQSPKRLNQLQGVTTCGLSSLASFPKILSSKHVCCVFRDIRDKNAVNQGFWSKTAVFSLSATKVHCLLIFWLPHLYNLLQPGIRKQHKYTSIHEHLYLAINEAKFALILFQPSHCSRVVLCIEAGCIWMVHVPSSISTWVLVLEEFVHSSLQ